MKPAVTVVIPTLGNLANLKKLVDSVVVQELVQGDLEILVVVNGVVADLLKKQIQTWGSTYQNVNIIFIETKGVNRARNYGLKSAQADLLLFFDDDCVIENKTFIQKHLQFHQNHPEVFAYGGGYNLTAEPAFWDRMYNYLQMKWLYSGIIDEVGKLVTTRVLLGGNFSIKSKLTAQSGLHFDEAIVYGGSEYEFFKQARVKKLPMVLSSLNVFHHTSETLKSVTLKLYKQGQGKAHIDLKYGDSDANSIKANQESLPLLQRLAMLYFNYVFWSGYYNFRGQNLGLLTHMLRDLVGNFNKARYNALGKISQQLSSKKDQGDRF